MQEPGGRFARYELLQLLGEGAMARVFKAYDPRTDRYVALKILKDAWLGDRALVDRFLREARAAGALSHRNIVRINSVDEVPAPYIDMEFVEGPSVAQVLQQQGRLPVREATEIVRALALALHDAHSRGRVHRDIKPSNILLAADRRTPTLADFGIASIEQPEATHLTQHGQMLGTPRYMSPEQIRGDPADARSDLFSLGVTFYEMVTGTHAFPGDTLVTLATQILQTDPRPVREVGPDVPPRIAAVIERLLAKASAARIQSAAELAAALEGAADPPQSRFAEAGARSSSPDSGGRSRRLWPRLLGGASLVALAAGIAVLFFWPHNQPPLAIDDVAETVAGQPVRIEVLTNDRDPDEGDQIRLVAAELTGEAPGRVEIRGDALVYDPGEAFATLASGDTATVTIAYTIEDRHGDKASAFGRVTVRGQQPEVTPSASPVPSRNQPPVAIDDAVEMRADQRILIDVIANDRDPDPDDRLELAAASLSPGAPGRLTVNGNLVEYDPAGELADLAADAKATVEIQYTVRDQPGAAADGRAVITVVGTSRPQEPVPPSRSPVLPSSDAALTAPQPTTTPVSAQEAWFQLAADVMSLPCARLEAEPGRPEISLYGAVADAAMRTRLLERIKTTPGMTVNRIDLIDQTSVLCRAFDLLSRHTLVAPRRLVRLDRPMAEVCADLRCYAGLAEYRLTDGEKLVLDLTMPDFASHLTVDYLMADGNVLHLWPRPRGEPEVVTAEAYGETQPPEQKIGIGDLRAGLGSPSYTIGPPFGRELVLVVAARNPLFRAARPAVEPSASYLEALEVALSQTGQGTRRPLASAMPFETLAALP